MKDDKITNPEPAQAQEIELTEDELDEVSGGAFGLAAADKDFMKKGLVLNNRAGRIVPTDGFPSLLNNAGQANNPAGTLHPLS